MKHTTPRAITLPDTLGDEAAAQLLTLLLETALALQHRYAEKRQRHPHQRDPRQSLLWDDGDPPF